MSVIGSEPTEWEKKILIQELHKNIDLMLNQDDKDFLFYALKQYRTYKNVAKLLLSITSCLDSPDKLDLLPHIRNLIPIRDLKKFDSIAPYDRMAHPPGSATRRKGKITQDLVIDRMEGGSLGFSIRGGWENKLGIFISSVDGGSPAEYAGLIVGDQIVSVNSISFEWITHIAAVEVLKNTNPLIAKVCSNSTAHQKDKPSYVWVSADEQKPTSKLDFQAGHKGKRKKVAVQVNWQHGGLGVSLRGGKEYGIGLYIASVDDGSRAAVCGLKIGDQIVDVNGHSFVDILHAEAVAILKSYQSLIITIKSTGKLPTVNETVKPSLRYSQSLPRDFKSRKHSAPPALSPIKTSQRVKPVAKVKPEQQVPRQMPVMTSTDYPDSAVSVPSLQFSTVQRERAQSMKVKTLRSQSRSTPEMPNEPDLVEKPRVRSSLPLKPSPLLYSSVSTPPTSKRFNQFKKEEFKFNSLPRGFKLEAAKKMFIEGMGTQVMHTSASHSLAKNLLLERASKSLSERECTILRERLQQYENGMKIEKFVDYLLPLLNNSEKLQLLTEIRSVLNAPDLATFDEMVSPREAEMLMNAQDNQQHDLLLSAIKGHGGVRNLRKTASADDITDQDHELGAFGSEAAQDILDRATHNSKDGSPRRLESFIAWEDDSFVAERRRSLRKKYQASTEPLVIELDKTCPTIGLSVDGGVDTIQKEIKITEVKEGGAAQQHGFLKAGYEILEVDGETVCGLKHREACMAIHKAFKSKNKPKMEMIVVPHVT